MRETWKTGSTGEDESLGRVTRLSAWEHKEGAMNEWSSGALCRLNTNTTRRQNSNMLICNFSN